jgi:hypothetical protein
MNDCKECLDKMPQNALYSKTIDYASLVETMGIETLIRDKKRNPTR